MGGGEVEESRKAMATEDFMICQLLDQAVPIADRFRALFTLRNLRGPKPRLALIKAMRDKSNLLAHEAAFALGQMQDLDAIPALKDALEDISSLHPIVRHEAAEALGAMGNPDCINILKRSLEVDPAREVRETCELALQRLQQQNILTTGMHERSPFLSIDPAAPASSDCTTHDLRVVLLDEEKDMYERYAALFALRNRGGSEAIQAIIAALKAESALLKHEVAYVLGQIQDRATANALADVLQDTHEHPMVRHEAAEALGSIADSGSVALLKKFQGDEEPIVSQSCEVAIRMLEFERNGKAFEYLYLEAPSITTN